MYIGIDYACEIIFNKDTNQQEIFKNGPSIAHSKIVEQ